MVNDGVPIIQQFSPQGEHEKHKVKRHKYRYNLLPIFCTGNKN